MKLSNKQSLVEAARSIKFSYLGVDYHKMFIEKIYKSNYYNFSIMLKDNVIKNS